MPVNFSLAAWGLPAFTLRYATAPHSNRLALWTMATGLDAAFTKMDWAPVPANPITKETL